jgi:hypothetical protein
MTYEHFELSCINLGCLMVAAGIVAMGVML